MFKERIYKIWKQFTTPLDKNEAFFTLCSKNEYTKSESNSQLSMLIRPGLPDCVQRTNIQNLKAIHNGWCFAVSGSRLCSKNEYTKSESNSQLARPADGPAFNCVQRTNIQNLKAIHNPMLRQPDKSCIVFKERIYKIWKQFTTYLWQEDCCSSLCSKNEYTKSESNSQQDQSLCQFFAHFSCLAFSTL